MRKLITALHRLSSPELQRLEDKLQAWWEKLSVGYVLVINKDQAYSLEPDWPTQLAPVAAIIWSPRSSDSLSFFCSYLLSQHPALVSQFLKADSLQEITRTFVAHYEILTRSYKVKTSKDRTLRG